MQVSSQNPGVAFIDFVLLWVNQKCECLETHQDFSTSICLQNWLYSIIHGVHVWTWRGHSPSGMKLVFSEPKTSPMWLLHHVQKLDTVGTSNRHFSIAVYLNSLHAFQWSDPFRLYNSLWLLLGKMPVLFSFSTDSCTDHHRTQIVHSVHKREVFLDTLNAGEQNSITWMAPGPFNSEQLLIWKQDPFKCPRSGPSLWQLVSLDTFPLKIIQKIVNRVMLQKLMSCISFEYHLDRKFWDPKLASQVFHWSHRIFPSFLLQLFLRLSSCNNAWLATFVPALPSAHLYESVDSPTGKHSCNIVLS